jgi:hypothetical protein
MTATEGPVHAFFREHETALWLLLISAFAMVLRFAGLTFQSYWFDELFNAWCSNPANSYARVIDLSLTHGEPPLQQLGMWLSYKALGYHEFAGRVPAALAGVAAIPVIYLLGRELFDSRTGLYAAALAAPNYFLVYYAQEAGAYAFLYFLTCLASLFFIRTLRSKSWLNPLLYAATTIALLYSHYFVLVMLLIQGCILLVYWFRWAKGDRQLLTRMGIAVLLMGAALLPLVPAIVQHASPAERSITQPSVLIAADYFAGYFGSTWLALCMVALVAVALIATAARALRESEPDRMLFGVITLLAWIALGFFLPWITGLVAKPVISDRNTVMLVPPIILLAACGLRSIPVLLLQRMVGLAILSLSLYQLLAGSQYYSAVKKGQYREIAAALTAYPTPLPVYALLYNDTRYNVYFEQLNSHLRAADYRALEAKLEAQTAEPLFWLVSGHQPGQDTDIKERFSLVQVALYTFRGAVAELLLDPQSAKQILLERSVLSGGGDNWLSVQPFVWQGERTQLLIALNSQARMGPVRKVQIDLLDRKGHVLETHAAELGAIPSTLQISPRFRAGDALRLVLRMPAGAPEPAVWMITSDSSPP